MDTDSVSDIQKHVLAWPFLRYLAFLKMMLHRCLSWFFYHVCHNEVSGVSTNAEISGFVPLFQ